LRIFFWRTDLEEPSALLRHFRAFPRAQLLYGQGPAAIFATEEFFFGRIRNAHTRSAYRIAVRRFLVWAEARGLELVGIAPKDVGQ